MPYTCRKVGNRFIVHKKNEDGGWTRLQSSGSHGSNASCQRQVRALYSQESKPKAEDASITGAIKGPLTLKDTGTVRINSPGGDLIAAIDAANFIREKRLSTVVTGQAASAAVLPLIAGNPAKMMSNTLIMIHNPRATLQGTFTAEELEEKKEAIEKAITVYANEIRGRVAPMSALMVDEWLKKDTYFTAEEALAHGLIDEIIPVHSRDVSVNMVATLPDRIVAHLSALNAEEDKMSLFDIAEKFGVEAKENADSDEIESGIVAFVEGLQTKFADLETSFKELKDNKPDPTPSKDPVPSGFVAIARKSRKQDLDGLVAKGKVAPCVIAEFEMVYCSDDALQAALSDDGSSNDNFDKIVAAIQKNSEIVSFGGETGAQRPPQGTDANPLLDDVNKRRKAAGLKD